MTTATKTTAWDELRDVQAQVERRRRLPDELERERRDALAGLERARQDLAHHYAAGVKDATVERELIAAVDDAAKRLEEIRSERVVGAREAARSAASEEEAFVREHLDRLAGELTAMAEAKSAAFVDAFEALRAAFAEYIALTSGWTYLERHGGVHATERLGSHHALDQAMRELNRVFGGAGVPLLVPKWATAREVVA